MEPLGKEEPRSKKRLGRMALVATSCQWGRILTCRGCGKVKLLNRTRRTAACVTQTRSRHKVVIMS